MSAPKSESAPAVIPATDNTVPQDHERLAAATLQWTDEGGDEKPDPSIPIAGAEDEPEEGDDPKPPIAGADEEGEEAPSEKPAVQKSSEKYKAKVLAARQAREEKAQRHQAQVQEQRRQQYLQAKERELNEKIALLESDPVEYFEKAGHNPAKIYQRMTQNALKPGETKIQTQLEQMQQLFEQERQARQQEMQALQDRITKERRDSAHQAAVTSFARHSSDGEKYPYLSRLSEEDRVEYGIQVATQYEDAQSPYTESEVAEVIEEYLQGLAEALTGAKSTGKGGNDTQAKSGSTAKGGKKPGSRTITSDLASQKSSSPKQDISEEARLKAATEAAQAWANSSST
jgi:hypothetical protein